MPRDDNHNGDINNQRDPNCYRKCERPCDVDPPSDSVLGMMNDVGIYLDLMFSYLTLISKI